MTCKLVPRREGRNKHREKRKRWERALNTKKAADTKSPKMWCLRNKEASGVGSKEPGVYGLK